MAEIVENNQEAQDFDRLYNLLLFR